MKNDSNWRWRWRKGWTIWGTPQQRQRRWSICLKLSGIACKCVRVRVFLREKMCMIVCGCMCMCVWVSVGLFASASKREGDEKTFVQEWIYITVNDEFSKSFSFATNNPYFWFLSFDPHVFTFGGSVEGLCRSD